MCLDQAQSGSTTAMSTLAGVFAGPNVHGHGKFWKLAEEPRYFAESVLNGNGNGYGNDHCVSSQETTDMDKLSLQMVKHPLSESRACQRGTRAACLMVRQPCCASHIVFPPYMPS
jgi:hypothetical protein